MHYRVRTLVSGVFLIFLISVALGCGNEPANSAVVATPTPTMSVMNVAEPGGESPPTLPMNGVVGPWAGSSPAGELMSTPRHTTAPTAAPVPTPGVDPVVAATMLVTSTATLSPTPTPTVTPTAVVEPTTTPTAAVVPVPTVTSIPMPAATPIPTPDPAARSVHLEELLPWVSNPLDHFHRQFAMEIRRLRWVVDGIGEQEEPAVAAYGKILARDPDLELYLFRVGWMTDAEVTADDISKLAWFSEASVDWRNLSILISMREVDSGTLQRLLS